jgi:DNA primase
VHRRAQPYTHAVRIRREDVDHVRERTRIDEIVGEHVTLKSGGVGSLKGLCPFHDEKTPSFHVRPALGRWHCFGCGRGGDVISFVQEVDHLGFSEAVELLAGRLGYQLRYEDDDGRGGARREQVGQRQRLVEANRLAAEFYAEQLPSAGDAVAARRFLADRGFDREAAALFGVGFAPRAGDALVRHLRGRGFTEDDLVASGVAARGQRGLYDRFRGRLTWPIRDVTTDVVGFGARRLFDDDRIEAKYLNTPETAVYKKSQVLYGVDLAKREIARERKAVVVEGYTDVMACHLSGIQTAVATCGTAFGPDHLRMIRRLIGDEAGKGSLSLTSDTYSRSVIFVFDGDAAGQKAAERAFAGDQAFTSQTYVAVAPEGLDPCDLRRERGAAAVRDLIERRQPMFEFAIRSAIERLELDTAEGRVQALRTAAPIVARIRDNALRPEYARQLAGWLGMDMESVARAVARAGRAAANGSTGAASATPSAGQMAPHMTGAPVPDPRDPIARVEREALECLLQVPALVPQEDVEALGEDAFEVSAYRAVFQAVRAAGGIATARTVSGTAWIEAVHEQAPLALAPLITQLAVTPLPADTGEGLARYAVSVVLRLAEVELSRRVGALHSRVQRLEADDPRAGEAFAELLAAETRRRTLRERITGA